MIWSLEPKQKAKEKADQAASATAGMPPGSYAGGPLFKVVTEVVNATATTGIPAGSFELPADFKLAKRN